MGICFSTIHPKYLWYEKSINKNNLIILYSFKDKDKNIYIIYFISEKKLKIN